MPHPAMSASAVEGVLGLAVVLHIDAASPENLGAAVERQLRARPAHHAIDLSGAQTARALVEQLAGTLP